MDEIIKKITQLKDWYFKNSANSNINKLLDFQDKLGTLSFNLSETYCQYSKDYNFSYIQRKYNFAIEKGKFIDQHKSATESDNLAEIGIKDFRESEVLNYEIAQRLNLIRQDVRMLLQLSQQRISHLKIELEYSRNNKQT